MVSEMTPPTGEAVPLIGARFFFLYLPTRKGEGSILDEMSGSSIVLDRRFEIIICPHEFLFVSSNVLEICTSEKQYT